MSSSSSVYIPIECNDTVAWLEKHRTEMPCSGSHWVNPFGDVSWTLF